MAKAYRVTAWVVLALAFAALAGPVLAQALPWVVNHDLKQCMPNAGIGLSGWVPAEVCPDGYTILVPKPPEQPWYIKLLEALNNWFGLSSKVLWLPKPATLAVIASAILLVRRFLQLFGGIFDKVTHGIGPVILNAIISFYVALEGKLADGLSAYELLEALFTFFGTWGVWEYIKHVVNGTFFEAILRLLRKVVPSI